jgi:hypothetical protein
MGLKYSQHFINMPKALYIARLDAEFKSISYVFNVLTLV